MTTKKTFKIGDVVSAVYPTVLACGSGFYTHAIVVKSEPLVLVSEETDMLWSATTHIMNLALIGTATAPVLRACMQRAAADGF